MMFQKIFNQLLQKPKKLFLIDGLGALLSAFFLGIILVRFEAVFGIPRSTLYLLASLPCAFAMFDFYCFQRIEKNIGRYLKLIARANLLYCILSIGLAFYHLDVLTGLAWIYIVIEVIIVVALALLEFKIANRVNGNDK